jgi:hypothetical protein
MTSYRWISIVMLAMLNVNCGRQLNRSRVSTELNEYFKRSGYRRAKEMLLNIGTLSASCSEQPDFDPVESEPAYRLLKQNGYLDIRRAGLHVWRVSLTLKGQNIRRGEPYDHILKSDCDSWQIHVPITQFRGYEISGILEDSSTHAKVDLMVTYAVTDLTKNIRSQARATIQEFEARKARQRFSGPMPRPMKDSEVWEATEGHVRELLGDDVVDYPTRPRLRNLRRSLLNCTRRVGRWRMRQSDSG